MKVLKGAIGVRIVADCVSNVSTALVQTIKYTKSDGTTGEWTATVGTASIDVDNESGETITYEAYTYIYYDTLIDDIDVLGDWKVQAYVELSGGLKTHGNDNEGKNPWGLLRVEDVL